LPPGTWRLAPGRRRPSTQEIAGFADTAASLPHVGLPVAANVAGWRGMLEGGQTALYPSMRLFRQRGQEDWPDVVTRIGRAMARPAA